MQRLQLLLVVGALVSMKITKSILMMQAAWALLLLLLHVLAQSHLHVRYL